MFDQFMIVARSLNYRLWTVITITRLSIFIQTWN